MKLPKQVPQFVLIFFICLIVVSGAFFGSLFLKERGFNFDLIQGFSKNNPFSSSSKAHFSLFGNNLKIKFEIAEGDKQVFSQIKQKLEIDSNIEQGLDIGLDPKTAEKIKNNLPTSVNLSFRENKLQFSNNILPSLKSSEAGEKVEYASGSGKLNYQTDGSNSMYINLENPSEFIKESTKAGSIYLSENSQSLFKVLSKIATIELNVNGKNISGEIALK